MEIYSFFPLFVVFCRHQTTKERFSTNILNIYLNAPSNLRKRKPFTTRIHSNRMLTVRCRGRLSCHAHPHTLHHACPLSRRMSPPPFAMHTPLCHTRPPPFTMHTPMWTEFLKHPCENITFPQLLLQTVTRIKLWR